MIKILLMVLVPVGLILGGFGYYRFVATKSENLDSPSLTEQTKTSDTPQEVPNTLPNLSLDERVKALEGSLTKLSAQNTPNSSSKPSTLDSKIASLESAVTELKARVAVLEKDNTTSSTSQSTVFIPIATNGGPWADKDWFTTTYEVSLNSADYPNYKEMKLEATFKLNEKRGTASVRLYNVSDNVGYSSADTTSDSYSLQTSSGFKIATGTKTYKLQIKSTEGAEMLIQSARLRVSF